MLLPAVFLGFYSSAAVGNGWHFTDVSAQAGVGYTYGLSTDSGDDRDGIVGGVAAGDYDDDGWVDLYLVSGGGSPNVLLHNQGDGTFVDVAAAAGVANVGTNDSGPIFGDLDGDGWLDLFVGGQAGGVPHVYRNRGDGTFEDVTEHTAWPAGVDFIGAALGDYDQDGDLDLVTTHWKNPNHIFLWRNDGGFHFVESSASAGLALIRPDGFSPTLTDINLDGWPDLLYVADFNTTEYFHNDQHGGFIRKTDSVITDSNGMGSAVGDYDNDGDLDWFVSSISPEPGVSGVRSGNRLYRNRGDGTFEDATDEAGVKRGFWGWASCFADFNNDGWLDLFHVNGFEVFPEPIWFTDPSRLFISNQDGTFTESSTDLGLSDTRVGRGLVCFDYDRDGDVDIFTANRDGPHRLFRNDGGNTLGNYLEVRLAGTPAAPSAVGAKVYATTTAGTQMRELRLGSNYVSNNPPELYFGLGPARSVSELRVLWPGGGETVLHNVSADQSLLITPDSRDQAISVPAGSRAVWLLLAALIVTAAAAPRFRRA